jgi:hypothetical protein
MCARGNAGVPSDAANHVGNRPQAEPKDCSTASVERQRPPDSHAAVLDALKNPAKWPLLEFIVEGVKRSVCGPERCFQRTFKAIR